MAATNAAPVLNLPLPELRPWGLFTQVATNITDQLGTRFPAGVQFQPLDVGNSLVLAEIDSNLCAVEDQVTDLRDWPDTITQSGFQIYDTVTCSALWKTPEEIAQDIARRWPLLISYALAAQFLAGADGYSLADATGLTAQSTVVAAIAELEEKLAIELGNIQGTIHMAPSVLAYAVTNGTVNLRNNILYSPGGHQVIADAGYQASETTTSTIYATGPVYYGLTERTPRPRFGFQGVDFAHDIINWFEDVYGVLLFDPTYNFKVAVTKA